MSCCQYVSIDHLAALIGQLRNGTLTDTERTEYERFFLKCVPDPAALAFIADPTDHPANPSPGTIPGPAELARVVSIWQRANPSAVA